MFIIPIEEAQKSFPEYKFIAPLTPSAQKAAFHVQDKEGRDLCFKIISPDYSLDRLQREIAAMQTINHPNVVSLKEYTYSSTQILQRHYIIEEFIPGEDLSEALERNPKWPRIRAGVFFASLCNGLSALQSARIVHRDLKPSNIRVRPDGTPVIIDFGLSRHLNLSSLTNTSDGAAIGTPLYFAPEQFRGNKNCIEHRTDLFALGIILHVALTGEHPFYQPKMTRQQLEESICSSEDYRTRNEFLTLPTDWRLLLTKLLAKERINRPTNASQVANILLKIKES